jgi:hypothetical protein
MTSLSDYMAATDQFEIASQSHYEGMQYCHVFSTWFSSVPCIFLSNLCFQLGVDYDQNPYWPQQQPPYT